MENSEFSTERGVQNPRVIDLVSLDRATSEVVLLMIENRSWGSDPDQLEQIQEKFNNYLDYVLDGYLYQHYPQYKDMPVRICFECPQLEEGSSQLLISAMQRYSESINLKFEVRHSIPGNSTH